MSTQKDSMIFYRSFYEAVSELDLKIQGKIYSAIFNYSFNLEEPDLQGVAKTIFCLIKPQLDANHRRYENGKQAKVKQNGSEDEANPKQDGSETEANDKQSTSETEANKNKNGNDNSNDNSNSNGKKNINSRKKTFIPPSLQEFTNYFLENEFDADLAKRAWTGYHENNWHDSHDNPIRNWKTKAQQVWFKNENKRNGSNQQNNSGNSSSGPKPAGTGAGKF